MLLTMKSSHSGSPRTFSVNVYGKDTLSAAPLTSGANRSLFLIISLVAFALSVRYAVAQKVDLSVDASKPGSKIDRNIFGQFAEH